MNRQRKTLLILVLAVAIAVHVILFAAGGQWRTVAVILIGVDLIGTMFVLGAIYEFKKLDAKEKQ